MFAATKQKKNKATKRYSLLGLKDSPIHNFCKIESESAKKVLEETKNIIHNILEDAIYNECVIFKIE